MGPTFTLHAACLDKNQGESYEMIRAGQSYFDLDCSRMTSRVSLAGTSIETFVETVHDKVVRAIVDLVVVDDLLPYV
jgi:hypothetical protein